MTFEEKKPIMISSEKTFIVGHLSNQFYLSYIQLLYFLYIL